MLYDEIREQIPNPYYPNELYRISSSSFLPKSKAFKEFKIKGRYYACINNKGFLHIYKITVKDKIIIILERFRFTKEKKLVFMNEYMLTEKDGVKTMEKIIRDYRISYKVVEGKYGNFLCGYVQYIGKLWKNTVEFDIETPNEAYIDGVPKYVQSELVKIFKKEIWKE